jgi:S-adenosylmethionine synthetase
MGDAVTGGGLHGKDLSKADVTLSIYCHIIAQSRQKPFKLSCNIGQDMVDGQQYNKLMNVVHQYILKNYGSFEKLAEWGLIK